MDTAKIVGHIARQPGTQTIFYILPDSKHDETTLVCAFKTAGGSA